MQEQKENEEPVESIHEIIDEGVAEENLGCKTCDCDTNCAETSREINYNALLIRNLLKCPCWESKKGLDPDIPRQEEHSTIEPKDLTDGEELFNIEMSNDSRGITVKIHCADSADAVLIAGFVISAFRKLGIESKSVSKVMP